MLRLHRIAEFRELGFCIAFKAHDHDDGEQSLDDCERDLGDGEYTREFCERAAYAAVVMRKRELETGYAIGEKVAKRGGEKYGGSCRVSA
jgi:hypothetical protein